MPLRAPRADERQRNFFGRYLLIAIGCPFSPTPSMLCRYDALN